MTASVCHDPGVYAIGGRWVFTGVGSPLKDRYIVVARGRIQAVTRRRPDVPIRDHFDCAVLPGLINAHTHLEFSHRTSPFGLPGQSFVSWLAHVIASRRAELDTITAEEQYSRWRTGYRELQRYGTVGVADIVTSGAYRTVRTHYPVAKLPVRCWVFRELLGLAREHWPHLANVAQEHADWMGWNESLRRGWSPHAPYTVSFEFLQQLVTKAAQYHVPLAMHLAESPEECELLSTGAGPLRDLLESVGAWDESAFHQPRAPSDYLSLLALAPRVLVIHGNYLQPEDWQVLVEHRDHMSMVFCPRTHAFFGHAEYRLADLLRFGVRVVLGTDSRATNPDLNVFEEMRYVAARSPAVEPSSIVRMASLWAAEALGCDEQFGSIVPGKLAFLTLVRLPPSAGTDPFESLWQGNVCYVCCPAGGPADGDVADSARPDGANQA